MMESVYNFSPTEILAFALVLLRMIGFVVTMPIFGISAVPTPVKILLAMMLSFVLFPQIGWKKLTVDLESMAIMTMAAREVFIGLFFGFIARMFFITVSMAGQLMSVSLGLSSAQLFNPAMGETSTAFDQFYLILATLFFLGVNGHHMLISGIFDTYRLVPLASTGINFSGLQDFAPMTSTVMAMAVKLSAPILVAILFMNLALAVIGRAVPQINILITSLPVNVLVGLFVVMVTLPMLIWQMNDLMRITADRLMQMVGSL